VALLVVFFRVLARQPFDLSLHQLASEVDSESDDLAFCDGLGDAQTSGRHGSWTNGLAGFRPGPSGTALSCGEASAGSCDVGLGHNVRVESRQIWTTRVVGVGVGRSHGGRIGGATLPVLLGEGDLVTEGECEGEFRLGSGGGLVVRRAFGEAAVGVRRGHREHLRDGVVLGSGDSVGKGNGVSHGPGQGILLAKREARGLPICCRRRQRHRLRARHARHYRDRGEEQEREGGAAGLQHGCVWVVVVAVRWSGERASVALLVNSGGASSKVLMRRS